MGIMAKGNGGDFPDPPLGLVCALCVDVVDLGKEESPFKDERTGKPKINHKIQIVWQLHEENEDGEPCIRADGQPFRVSRFYTLSLNERANLRKDLDSWRGIPFTDEELKDGFDVEKLLNVQAKLNLVNYKNNKGENRVIVDSVLKPSKKDPVIAKLPEFQREKDVPGGRDMRSPPEDSEGAAPAGNSAQNDEDEDDMLPF
jgi:hypothetical protein